MRPPGAQASGTARRASRRCRCWRRRWRRWRRARAHSCATSSTAPPCCWVRSRPVRISEHQSTLSVAEAVVCCVMHKQALGCSCATFLWPASSLDEAAQWAPLCCRCRQPRRAPPSGAPRRQESARRPQGVRRAGARGARGRAAAAGAAGGGHGGRARAPGGRGRGAQGAALRAARAARQGQAARRPAGRCGRLLEA